MVTMYAATPPQGTQSFNWSSLLYALKDRRLIPIIGRDLLELPGGVPYYRYLAVELAKRLGVELPANVEPTIEEVALRHSRQAQTESPYAALRALLDEPSPFGNKMPDALVKLARIEPLWLFVSTTFDDLMARTLREERKGVTVEEVDHLLQTPADLASDKPQQGNATVFPLLGHPAQDGDYALFDHERLDQVLKLPEMLDGGKLGNLGKVVHGGMLLFLGCGFPDWLMRFFIRALRWVRVQTPVEKPASIAEARELDTSLVFFLENRKIGVYSGDALAFLDELEQRWRAFQSRGSTAAAPAPAPAGTDVVLSCHDGDRARIEDVAGTLRRWGVRVAVSSWPSTPIATARAAIGASAAYVAFLSSATAEAWKARERRLEEEWEIVDARGTTALSVHLVGLAPDAMRALRQPGRSLPAWMDDAGKHSAENVALRLVQPLREAKRLPDADPLRVYCVFAGDDRAEATQFTRVFSPEKWLVLSHRDSVPPGVEAEAWCRRALDEANAILLLVSASLLADHDDEIKRALARRSSAVVLPVALKTSGWSANAEQAKFELFVPGNGPSLVTATDPSAAWLEVGREVQLRVLDKHLGERKP